MLDELSMAIKSYQTKWEALVAARSDQRFFAAFQPTAVGWKTEDLADFDRRFAVLRELSDQIHLGWVNERWLATLHLKDTALPGDIRIVKLMQRRPGSTDATGLDHLDFLLSDDTDAKEVLMAEADLQWTEEKNGEHCKWLSIWFAGNEAKLRRDTVLDVCIDEMHDARVSLFGKRT